MTLDEARKVARKHRVTLDKDGDPATERTAKRAAASLQFLAIAEDYIAVRQKDMKPRNHVECIRNLRKLWKPLHGLSLGTVSRPLVATHNLLRRCVISAINAGRVREDYAREGSRRRVGNTRPFRCMGFDCTRHPVDCRAGGAVMKRACTISAPLGWHRCCG
jgi:hypothetical protein